jgi:hypothetical protein
MNNQESNSSNNNENKKALKFSVLRSLKLIAIYLKDITNIHDGVDVEGSIEAIKNDIDFKGVNIWILGASIVIASIGLNVNSVFITLSTWLVVKYLKFPHITYIDSIREKITRRAIKLVW